MRPIGRNALFYLLFTCLIILKKCCGRRIGPTSSIVGWLSVWDIWVSNICSRKRHSNWCLLKTTIRTTGHEDSSPLSNTSASPVFWVALNSFLIAGSMSKHDNMIFRHAPITQLLTESVIFSCDLHWPIVFAVK